MFIAANYHYIRDQFDEPYPSIFGVTPEQFENELDQIGQTASFIGLQDLIEIITYKKKLPEKAAVITFDDGFKEQYEIAWPVLKRKGIPAVFFVNTKPIDEEFVTITHKIHLIRAYTSAKKLVDILHVVLDKEQIDFTMPSAETAANVYRYDTPEAACLKYFLNYSLNETEQKVVIDCTFKELGFDERKISKDLYMNKHMLADLASENVLGTHGHEHRPLGLLPDRKAVDDVRTSIEKLEKWTGHRVKALSYPFGFKKACSKAVADYCKKKGVKFAFTMERAANVSTNHPYFLARMSNSDLPFQEKSGALKKFWEKVQPAKWFRGSFKTSGSAGIYFHALFLQAFFKFQKKFMPDMWIFSIH
jgi:peptidoglycan/xylan/chitin deacetylase (PgdA/CDA1 family)